VKKIILFSILIIVFLGYGVILKPKDIDLKKRGGNMQITSIFGHNSYIPSFCTCDGEDLAPELIILDVPAGAKELVLIVDDPDAPMGIWIHWVIYNLPVDITKIDAMNLPQGTKQGITDFGRTGWGGPCPPSGTHRYFFKLYAIDTTLNLEEGAKKSQVEKAMQGHIIEQTELIGLYKRQ